MTAPDERVETAAGVLREHQRCRCCEGCQTCPSIDVPIDQHQAAAVVAALDGETARLREEVGHWQQTCTWWNEACQRAWEQRDFNATAASTANADLATARAALDRVRALATDSRDRGGFGGVRLVAHVRIADLRAALDPKPQACDRGPCHLPRGHDGRCNPGRDALPHERYDAVLDSGPEETR